MHHGGEGLHRLVCFQYSSPAPATHSLATRSENSHSSIKSLFSPLVHNILLLPSGVYYFVENNLFGFVATRKGSVAPHRNDFVAATTDLC